VAMPDAGALATITDQAASESYAETHLTRHYGDPAAFECVGYRADLLP
jgi:hypothetical protein